MINVATKKHTQNPFFSIVTVVKNDLPGLRITYLSVIEQTLQDFEWIIIDGKSSDGATSWAKRQDINVNVLSEPDDGIYDAMNKGILLARGNYTVFLNAGDVFYSKHTLHKVNKNINLNRGSVDVLYGGAELQLKNNKKWYRPPKNVKKYIWHGLPANHQASYFSLEFLANFHYDLQYKYCGDYYIAAILYLKAANTIYLNEPLVIFRVGDISFQQPVSLITEAYAIQRDVLKTQWYMRIISAVKRIIATVILRLISKFP